MMTADAVSRIAFGLPRVEVRSFADRHERARKRHGRRRPRQVPPSSDWNDRRPDQPDRTGANFAGAALYGLDLPGANLCGADPTDAELGQTNLNAANLCAANLIRIRLRGARLEHASLVLADLTDGDLAHANLLGAQLVGASLIRARLSSAVLEDTDLTEANVSGTNLTEAELNGRCRGLRGVRCEACGTRSVGHGRREVRVPDLPIGDRRVVLCGASACGAARTRTLR